MIPIRRTLLLNGTNPLILLQDPFSGGNLDGAKWSKQDSYATTQLVTNGTFDANITGWTDASDVGSSISYDGTGHQMILSSSSGYARARQSITTIVGVSYTLNTDYNGNVGLKVGTSAGGSQILDGFVETSCPYTFTATATTTWLEFNCTSDETDSIDNVSVLPTYGLITVSGGLLNFAGGLASPVAYDPAIVYKTPIVRQAGTRIYLKAKAAATNKNGPYLTLSNALVYNNTATQREHNIRLNSSGLLSMDRFDVNVVSPVAYSADTWLWYMIEIEATGVRYYYSADGITYSPIWIDATGTTTPLYVAIASANAISNGDDAKIVRGSPRVPAYNATPAAPSPAPGGEALTDIGFETWTSATDLTSWSESVAGTSTVNREATVIHGGTYAVRLDIDAGNDSAVVYQQATAAVGTWLIVSFWARSSASGKTLCLSSTNAGGIGAAKNPGTSYTQYIEFRRVTIANPNIGFREFPDGATSASVYFDDVSCKPLGFTYLGDSGVHNGVYQCSPTISDTHYAGILAHANSTTAPTYGILAYYDKTAGKASMVKFVNGVWTDMIAPTAVAYSAGAVLEIVSNGTQHALYYGKVKVGATITLDVSANYGTHCLSMQTNAADSVGASVVLV